MARQFARDEVEASGPDTRRRRLTGTARRASIMEAAALVFERTGDLGSTTTKMIAREAGVNEAMLYRYFGSKEEIFFAAVVEPLKLPMKEFFARLSPMTRPLTPEGRLEFLSGVMHDMVVQLGDRLGGLGLVLFGAPETASSFFATAWDPAVRELAAGWTRIFEDAGMKKYNDPYLSAHVVIGSCLMMAISKRHGGEQSDADLRLEVAQCTELARMMYDGVFAYEV